LVILITGSHSSTGFIPAFQARKAINSPGTSRHKSLFGTKARKAKE